MPKLEQIGIVACSAEGASLCYRTICETGAKLLGGYTHPPVSMHTPSFEDYMNSINRDDWAGVADLMVDSANKLASIGADLLICSDNTMHRVFPHVLPRTSLPWVHIADVVADEAVQRGFRRLGILGTRWLVDSEVYPEKLTVRNMEHAPPAATERDKINRIIMDELVRGVFKHESTDYIRGVIQRMKADGCDAVVLGCTELPLILDDSNCALPVLDSTRLLAREAVRRAIKE